MKKSLMQTVFEKAQMDMFSSKKQRAATKRGQSDMFGGDKPKPKAAAAGPFIGKRGGKWADAKHTIPWKEGAAKQSKQAHGDGDHKDFQEMHGGGRADHAEMAERHFQLESEARSAGKTGDQVHHGQMSHLHLTAKAHHDIKHVYTPSRGRTPAAKKEREEHKVKLKRAEQNLKEKFAEVKEFAESGRRDSLNNRKS